MRYTAIHSCTYDGCMSAFETAALLHQLLKGNAVDCNRPELLQGGAIDVSFASLPGDAGQTPRKPGHAACLRYSCDALHCLGYAALLLQSRAIVAACATKESGPFLLVTLSSL